MSEIKRFELLCDLIEIAGSESSLDDKLSRMLRQILRLETLNSKDQGCIFLLDEDTDQLVMAHEHNIDQRIAESCSILDRNQCLCGKALDNNSSLFKYEIDEDHRFFALRSVSYNHGNYVIPLRQNEKTIGILNVKIQHGQEPRPDMMRILEAAAAVMAATIQAHERIHMLSEQRNSLTEQVKESTRELARIASFAQENPNPVMAADMRSFALNYANSAAEMLLSFWNISLGDPLPEALRLACEQARDKGMRIDVRMEMDQLSYEFVCSANRQSDLVHIYGNDITALLWAQQEQRKMQKKSAEGQRLKSLGMLSGGIAHRFNNLLMVIMGNCDLLKMSMDESRDTQYLDKVQHACVEASALCQQMQTYAGKGKMEDGLLNVNANLEQIGNLLDVTTGPNTVLKIELDDDVPAIQGDKAQIQQLIVNLIQNAGEAVGDSKGMVTIRTRCEDVDDDYIKMIRSGDAIRPGRYLSIEVCDDGVGMSSEELDQMFDPFFSTKFVGRGMGLSVVEGIVRAHGGAIHVYSEEGHGTRIKVLIPSIESVRQASDVVETVEWDQRQKVMVIDDDSEVRNLTLAMCQHYGYQTAEADNGADGVALFRKLKDQVGLVIVDLSMPGMDGAATMKALLEIDPDLPVVVMSGYAEEEVISALNGSQAGFLGKPFRPDQLYKVLDSTLSI